jgi:hypothetical protein
MLVGLKRKDAAPEPDVISGWAADAGWSEQDAWMLRGIAQAVAYGVPDIGASVVIRRFGRRTRDARPALTAGDDRR